MKRKYKIMLLLLFFTIFLSTATSTFTITTHAATINPGITLDGDFTDWNGKPEISDIKHDIKSPAMDFINAKYIADNNYLYLYVERLAASKSQPWHFQVIIPNGTSGQNKNINLFNRGKISFVPVFDVNTSLEKSTTLVTVSYSGQTIETTLSSSSNGRSIEFRIPLNMVGLSGFDHEVQFTLLSDKDDEGTVDMLPDAYPITITTGPTGFMFTSILFFIGISFMAFRRTKVIHAKNSRTFQGMNP